MVLRPHRDLSRPPNEEDALPGGCGTHGHGAHCGPHARQVRNACDRRLRTCYPRGSTSGSLRENHVVHLNATHSNRMEPRAIYCHTVRQAGQDQQLKQYRVNASHRKIQTTDKGTKTKNSKRIDGKRAFADYWENIRRIIHARLLTWMVHVAKEQKTLYQFHHISY